MLQDSLQDTIAAISTPLGQGGIGIVRLSGTQALAIADEIFFTNKKEKPSCFKSHSVHYGQIVSNQQGQQYVIDEALLIVMRGPKSYTREDVVEISCHAGVVSLKKILSLVLALGARLAEPGEFTKRAFLNGRIDLTQAEAVADIINAKTETFLKISMNQLKGDLRIALEAIRDHLMNVYVEIEAILNFPEDDINASSHERLERQIQEAARQIQELIFLSDQGRILKEGVKVVICGKPNVGKSSLLNIFLRQPRAIVSPIQGTTRDTIEETAQIQDIPLQFVDTAGILDPRDPIEEEAIRRSHWHIDQADVVLVLFDVSQELSKEDEQLIDRIRTKKVVAVFNKCDCLFKVNEEKVKQLLPGAPCVKISALHRQGIDILEKKIIDFILGGQDFQTNKILVSNLRQVESLRASLSFLQSALDHFVKGLSLEFVSEEIKGAVYHLDRVTGKDIDMDLLDKIFSSFCIGK